MPQRRGKVVRDEFVKFRELFLLDLVFGFMPNRADPVDLFFPEQDWEIYEIRIFLDDVFYSVLFAEFLVFVFQLKRDLRSATFLRSSNSLRRLGLLRFELRCQR